MGVKRQQGSGDQKDLFDEALKASLRHGDAGDGGTGAGARAEPQAPTASERQRALTRHLMEEVASSANLNLAYKRVKANKGAAGVDGMTVDELAVLDRGEPRGADRLAAERQLPTQDRARGGNPQARRRGAATRASRRWWTVSCSRRSCKSWSRSSIRHSRRRASASARAGAPTKRSPRPDSTLPTGATSSWTSTWRSSSMLHQIAPSFMRLAGRGRGDPPSI